MTRIFLCYRSGDDAYAAALLDEMISRALGADEVFRASRSILPGENYSSAITTALRQCETMIVIIGPTWEERLIAHKEAGNSDVDWVRVEIATALDAGKRVIPVLLSRTHRLTDEILPPDLADLFYKQYMRFEHRNIEEDFAQLVAVLRMPEQKLIRVAADDVTVWCEEDAEGNADVDIVQRDELGRITGRLSGRAPMKDTMRLGTLIAGLGNGEASVR